MKKLLAVCCFLWLSLVAVAQSIQTDPKFSPETLRQDLDFLRTRLLSAHADPYSEITKEQYQALFKKMENGIRDSLTAIQFFQLVKPAIAHLSDEHADISLPKGLSDYHNQPVFLPFSLKKSGDNYIIDTVLSSESGLSKGDIIKQINGVGIKELIENCVNYTAGYPGQRKGKALSQFGYLYTIGHTLSTEATVQIKSGKKQVKGVSFSSWYNYLVKLFGGNQNCQQLLSYRKIGETGYIDACSFGARGDSAFKAYERTADSLFALAKRDQVKQVIVDVSKNSGGNSALGDFLIKQFYTGDYLDYQMNWRRSDEYLEQLTSWGLKDPVYEKMHPGEVMHHGPDTPYIKGVADPYKGKVYIMIGSGTFSSAIMFATIIKDNKMATLIGEVPKDGHPTHFGELYGTVLPNTKLALRFGVKEWIRPLGKNVGNTLDPDIIIPVDGGPEEVVKRLSSK